MNDETVAIKLTKHDEEIGSLKHRVKDLEEQNDTIQSLALSVKELAVNMQNMIKEQERHSKAIEALEEKPAKRWDTLATVIITALASGIITFILSHVLI